MKKEIIIVPNGIRFISDWSKRNNGYSLKNYPFPHILDKKIPGCGFTEYCLTNEDPTILCSPRLALIENKMNQHPGEIFYFKNPSGDSILDVEKDLTTTVSNRNTSIFREIKREKEEKERQKKLLEIYKENLSLLTSQLDEYLLGCTIKQVPPKIIVTYDSFRILKEYLRKRGILQNFQVVIDEFQSIFTDSRFKSDTELSFVDQVKDIDKVCLVSATPMLDEYLDLLPEFNQLPYFELDWTTEDPLRISKPDLYVRTANSLVSVAKKIIDSYKSGEFEEAVVKDSNGNNITIQSKEAVFYVNSVKNILSIISKAELSPEECNILCANTPYNQTRLKNKLGSKFTIGSVPLRGEPHKMFTFCTRTVYLGADFYSTNARSFILSDANIDSLAVDISLDLPQILGRQRLIENPWKNRAEFYYRTLSGDNVTKGEDFNARVQEKLSKTKNLLDSYSCSPDYAKHDLAENYQYVAKNANYKDNYVAVNVHAGGDLLPVFNELVAVSEKRAYDIQQIDYKDRFTVFSAISSNNMLEGNRIIDFLQTFQDLEGFKDRMKFLCNYGLTEPELCVVLDQIPLQFKNYYNLLGPERLRANGYNITRVSREAERTEFPQPVLNIPIIKNPIVSSFSVGSKYTLRDIKTVLSSIYSQTGYNKTPRATDINEFFETKQDFITIDKKRVNALRIIKLKD